MEIASIITEEQAAEKTYFSAASGQRIYDRESKAVPASRSFGYWRC